MSEHKTAWQDMGYTHHDVAHDVAVSGERCRADHDRIRALEAENARLREALGEAVKTLREAREDYEVRGLYVLEEEARELLRRLRAAL